MNENYSGLKRFIEDCTSSESIKEIVEKYCFKNINEIYHRLNISKKNIKCSEKQCNYARSRINYLIEDEKICLAKRVEKEILDYKSLISQGDKPLSSLSTNTQLAAEYTNSIYGDKMPIVSKANISKILHRYIGKKILKFREKELLRDNYMATILPLDKSHNGKIGGHITKGLKKKIGKRAAIEKGRNGAKVRWRNHKKNI